MIDDMRMYDEEHGTLDGSPLVLLHGFTLTGDQWVNELAAFGRHYRLLVPDLRGHGRTDNPGGAAAMNHRQFVRGISAFCHGLGVDRAAFCGFSGGAMVQLSLAVYAPHLTAVCIPEHLPPADITPWRNPSGRPGCDPRPGSLPPR